MFAYEFVVVLKADFVDGAVEFPALGKGVFETGVGVLSGRPFGNDKMEVLGCMFSVLFGYVV